MLKCIKSLYLSADLLQKPSDIESAPKIPSTLNPFSANFTKWSNTLKQFVGTLPKIFLSVFDHFVGLALKGLGCPEP